MDTDHAFQDNATEPYPGKERLPPVFTVEELAALYETSREINTQSDLTTLLNTVVQRATRLLEAEQRQREIAETLGEVARMVNSSLELDEVLDKILLELERVIPYDAAGISLVGKDDLQIVASRNFVAPESLIRTPLPLSHFPLSLEAIRQKRPLLVPDTLQEPRYKPGFPGARPARCLVLIPLISRENVKGVLTVVSYTPHRYSPVEADLAFRFAQQVAIAIENASLYEQARQEIAERKQAETALRESEEKYRTLFEDSRDAIVITTPSGRIIDVNQAALDLFGYTRDEVLHLNALDVYVNPDDRLRFQQALIQNGSVRDFEIKLWKKNKVEMDCLLTTTLRWTGDGQTLTYRTIMRDITAKKQAEKELSDYRNHLEELVAERTQELALKEKEEQRQRQIAESLREVATVLNGSLDRDTVLDKILEQLRRVIDYDGASILLPEGDDLVIWNAFYSDAAIGFRFPLASNNPAARVFKHQQPLVIDNVLLDPDWVQLTYPIRSWMGVPLLSGQKTIGILNIDSFEVGTYAQADTQVVQTFANQAALAIQNAQLFNETQAAKQAAEAANAELQAANIALKAANIELDAFAHTVAHDLQNPLGLIIGYSDYLIENFSETEPEQSLKILQTLRKTGQKMSNITNELLLLASVRKGTISLEALDMAEIVEQAQQRLAFMIEEYEAKILLPESWPVARGYAPWVEEVWANYLSNGLKYGGRPPHLALGATMEEEGLIRFWIRDNGPGLAPEAQAQLFSQFTRLDKTRATGHGLGLSIVKRIVEKLGGQVGVESRGIPGEGSVFSFTLPSF